MRGSEWVELRSAMKRKGLSGRAMARELGVHYVTVSHWLNGTTEPCLRQLVDIADCLNASLDELLGRKRK